MRSPKLLFALFLFLPLSIPALQLAPDDIDGRGIVIFTKSGQRPFPSSGRAAMTFDHTNSTWNFYPLTAGMFTDFGSWAYQRSDDSHATITINSQLDRTYLLRLVFSTTNSGNFAWTGNGRTWMAGSFKFLSDVAPIFPTNVYQFQENGRRAQERMFFDSINQDTGTYTGDCHVQDLSGNLLSLGSYSYAQSSLPAVANVSLPSLDNHGVTAIGNLFFQDATSGYYLLTTIGTEFGTFRQVVAPGLVSNPQDIAVPLHRRGILRAKAAGDSLLHYQWYGQNGVVTNATSPLLVLNNVTESNAGPYFLVISNDAGSVTSSVANVSIIYPPVITAQPQPAEALASSAASFSVEADGTQPLTYQWRHNGNPIAGATNDVLVLPLAAQHGGAYQVVVRNAAGVVASTPAKLTVLQPVHVTKGPGEVFVHDHQTATIKVLAGGSSPQFQWSFAGQDIPGATTPTLSLPNVTPEQAGQYTLSIKNDLSNTADTTTLVVLPAN